MATVFQQFYPEEAMFLGTAFPQYKKINGTNFPVSGLYFDAADGSNEQAFWKFRAINYGAGNGNFTIDIEWYADTATAAQSVVWDAQLSAISPNTDDIDIETDGLDTENTVTDAQIAGVDQRLHRATITLVRANLDGVAADDYCTIVIRRDTTAANPDTLSGDAVLVLMTISYSDTA